MPISGFQAVAAYHNGKQVSGIYRRPSGEFEVKKGVVKILAPEFEYSFDFTVAGKRYRSIFGKDSNFGKVGASGKWESSALEEALVALLRFRKNAMTGEGPTSIKEELEISRHAAEEKHRQELRNKSVEELVELFLEDIALVAPGIKTNRPRTINEYSLNLYRDVVPAIGKRKAKDIVRGDITDIIEKIVARGAMIQANRTISACSRLFNWALKKGKVEYNPCSLMEKYEESPRTRVLTEPEQKEITPEEPRHEEIKALWLKLQEDNINTEARVLMFCILLGSRPGEICKMRWDDIDKSNWWSLEETKTQEVILDCYLTPTALALLGDKKESGPVFPMIKKKEKSIPVDRLSRYVRDNDYLGLSRWQPGDLRRTFTTLGTGVGLDHFSLDLAQGRKNSSVIRKHYDKRRYYRELRELFETVEKEILRIVTQSTD